VAEVIAHANAQDAVMVWSFLPQALANMRKAAPHLPHVLLSEETASDWPRIRQSALDLGLQGVSLHHRHLSPDTVRDARQADLSVYAWTLDSEQDIRGAIALGVDGIVSNYPERVSAALSA
jgi:glycerophosphoryl diester phosphodiesterase